MNRSTTEGHADQMISVGGGNNKMSDLAVDVPTAFTVGGAIRTLRTHHRLSARALSARAGLSPSYVNKVESGEIEPSFKAFARLARTLHMTHAEVMFLLGQESVTE